MCNICLAQIEIGHTFDHQYCRKLEYFRKEEDRVSYAKFIEKLLAPPEFAEELGGCEIQFPDTVFFGEDSKPAFIGRMDKDGKLTAVTNKLGLHDIRQKFQFVQKGRRAEFKQFLETTPESGDRDAVFESMIAEFEDNEGDISDKKQVKFYEDFCMMRFKDSEEVRVLKEDELINQFQKRLNDPFWKRVELVQTCVKAKIGVGKPIFVHYFAPMDESNPAA